MTHAFILKYCSHPGVVLLPTGLLVSLNNSSRKPLMLLPWSVPCSPKVHGTRTTALMLLPWSVPCSPKVHGTHATALMLLPWSVPCSPKVHGTHAHHGEAEKVDEPELSLQQVQLLSLLNVLVHAGPCGGKCPLFKAEDGSPAGQRRG